MHPRDTFARLATCRDRDRPPLFSPCRRGSLHRALDYRPDSHISRVRHCILFTDAAPRVSTVTLERTPRRLRRRLQSNPSASRTVPRKLRVTVKRASFLVISVFGVNEEKGKSQRLASHSSSSRHVSERSESQVVRTRVISWIRVLATRGTVARCCRSPENLYHRQFVVDRNPWRERYDE